MKIAYLINDYPKVSHSFIRREILALERQGVSVQRIALRGWDGVLVDADDQRERTRTQYVLQGGLKALLLPVLRMLLSRPSAFFAALSLAWRMSRRADRALPFHLIYLVEACAIAPMLQRFGAQHLHAHFGTNPAEVAMLASKLSGVPYSFTVHGPEEFDRPQFLHISEKIQGSAFVVAISSFGRSQLFRWIASSQWHKVEVVHCGLEASFHEVSVQPLTTAARLVCIGRLCEQKGQLLLVKAVHQLQQRGVALELVLAGDGDMRAEIETLIRDCGLQQQVRITGWISSAQVREELLAARAMVLPSFAEGLPVVIMEAMALRRPVLTTYVAGIPELVVPGETGWLFPSGDVDALADCIERFLATPLDALEAQIQKAHARVLARHSIEVEAGKLVSLFGISSAKQAH
jgi:colanic acid/amylovoran biosynthesis glycosyltransferase